MMTINPNSGVCVSPELLEAWADRFSKAQMFKQSSEIRALIAQSADLKHQAAGQVAELQERLALVEAENAARARQGEIINDRYASALNTSEAIGKELDQAKARSDELESVVRMAREFVKNGIELGYIIMPDDDTPDPAHELLPRMNAALGNEQT